MEEKETNAEILLRTSLQHTTYLSQLFEVAKELRDEVWIENFFNHVLDAALETMSDNVMLGPDSFPYVLLKMPAREKEFRPVSVRNFIDWAIEKGVGIVVSGEEGYPEWVFSFGNLWSYKVFGSFLPKNEHLKKEGKRVLQQETEVLVGLPSEAYLPSYVRRAIKQFMKDVLSLQDEPRVALMYEPEEDIQSLIFSIFPEDFSDEKQFDSAMRMLQWFLPSNYAITGVSKEATLAADLKPF